MRIPHIYYPGLLKENSRIELSERAANHLIRVLRLQENALLRLFNGKGGEYEARIKSIDKNKVTVTIDSFHPTSLEPPIELHLGQAILRTEKMDWLIQKSVELGVKSITPLITKRSQIKLDQKRLKKRLQHWEGIIISACEQCGRNELPSIHLPIEFQTWCEHQTSDLKFILIPETDSTLSAISNTPNSISFVVGPEGGFSEDEITTARMFDFHALRLGPRILRTETAGLVALAAFLSKWGDIIE